MRGRDPPGGQTRWPRPWSLTSRTSLDLALCILSPTNNHFLKDRIRRQNSENKPGIHLHFDSSTSATYSAAGSGSSMFLRACLQTKNVSSSCCDLVP